MRHFKIKNRILVLLALVGVGSTMVVLSPSRGATPSAEKKDQIAEVPQGQPGKSDKDKLQGNWQIVALDLGAMIIKLEDKSTQWKGTFEKEVFFQGDRYGQVGHSNSQFKLDETCDPKRITVYSDDGKHIFRGIYAIEGDTLKLCMNGDGKSTRHPEEFATKKGSPIILTTLKRVAMKE
jgi:uncharacterized protein (TIGR03067 family)